jgi:hypothetical protein
VPPIVVPLLLAAALGSAPTQVVPTQCRVGGLAWQNCEVAVLEPGSSWQVQVGLNRWSFQHDGSGTVRMRQGQGPWQKAEPRWEGAESLCWGKLCARGPLPLD